MSNFSEHSDKLTVEHFIDVHKHNITDGMVSDLKIVKLKNQLSETQFLMSILTNNPDALLVLRQRERDLKDMLISKLQNV